MKEDAARQTYDRRSETFGTGPTGYFWELGRALAELVQPPAHQPVLDIACGTGAVSVALGRAGARVASLDLSEGMLDQLRKRVDHHPLGLVQGSACALPFADAAFDAVTCGFAVHIVPDVPALLGEICRVLRVDGRFGLTFWRYDEPERTPMTESQAFSRRRTEDAAADYEHARTTFAPDRLASLATKWFSAVRVVPLAIQWEVESLDVWIEAQFDMWAASAPVTDAEAQDARTRFGEAARAWTQPDGRLIFPVHAFALVG